MSGDGKKPSARIKSIAENMVAGMGIKGGGILSILTGGDGGEPYVKDQAKMDEAKRLLDEELVERAREIWNEMEKNGE